MIDVNTDTREHRTRKKAHLCGGHQDRSRCMSVVGPTVRTKRVSAGALGSRTEPRLYRTRNRDRQRGTDTARNKIGDGSQSQENQRTRAPRRGQGHRSHEDQSAKAQQ